MSSTIILKIASVQRNHISKVDTAVFHTVSQMPSGGEPERPRVVQVIAPIDLGLAGLPADAELKLSIEAVPPPEPPPEQPEL